MYVATVRAQSRCQHTLPHHRLANRVTIDVPGPCISSVRVLIGAGSHGQEVRYHDGHWRR